MSWNGKHSESYKSIYDVIRYPYEKHKEVLKNCRANLINHKRSNWSNKHIDMYEAFIYTLYLTGGRISEVLTLRVKDILVDENKEWLEFILPTKKSRKNDEPIRSIPIYLKDKENKQFLDPIIKWYDYVVNKIENDSSLNDTLRLYPIDRFQGYYACKVGIGSNPHFERKIFITQKATRNNMSIPKLQKLSGHKSAGNLVYYLNVGTDDIKEDLKRNVKDT